MLKEIFKLVEQSFKLINFQKFDAILGNNMRYNRQ